MAEKLTKQQQLLKTEGRQEMKSEILGKLETKMMDPELSMQDETYQAYRSMVTIIGRIQA